MRTCEICGESMYSSLAGCWLNNKFYEIHENCKKRILLNAIKRRRQGEEE